MSRRLDLAGRVFGMLTVLEPAGPDNNGNIMWKCVCSCADQNIRIIRGPALVKKNGTRSCGCLRSTKAKTHGLSKTPAYAVWSAMKQRCHNPNDKNYFRYGAKGRFVCDEWRESFENFWRDMGPTYESGLTLERRNNELGYSKDNCYWATQQVQGGNKDNNIKIDTDTGSRLLLHAAADLGIGRSTVYQRRRRGMSKERWLEPVQLELMETPDGPMTFSQAGKHFGIPLPTLSQRRKRGWSQDRLFMPPWAAGRVSSKGRYFPDSGTSDKKLVAMSDT